MKKQIIRTLLATAFLSFFTVAASADDVSQQSQDRGVYAGLGTGFPTVIQLLVGYQLNQYAAVEAMYSGVGPTVDAKLIWPIHPSYNLYAKAGVSVVTEDDFLFSRGVDPYIGIGTGVRMTPHTELSIGVGVYAAKCDDSYCAVPAATVDFIYHF